jgi:phosphogluconate dehydratase
MHPRVQQVTERLVERSRKTRERYLAMMAAAASEGPQRGKLQCANFAHGVAGCASSEDKQRLRLMNEANVAIVSAYNDMLSAHQPYEHFPELIKQALREVGSVGQFAGGVPAMCDGVTQGEAGMEMSLASREVIAMSTAVALSHNMFDAALLLGICDKIVPGLMIGALRFGHLPTIFVPGGPMPSGIPNKEKAEVRQRYAEGKASREELLESEMKSYHSPGTCTFYGTANTNQVVMEIMGLHLPGSSFVNPYTPLRDALTREAARQVVRLTHQGGSYTPLCRIVDEKAIVNSVVALNATGGSTNHTLHIPAFARAADVRKLRETGRQLQTALDADRDVSLAIGIVMERRRLGRQDAFELLRGQARTERRKLIELAREIVLAAEKLNLVSTAAAEPAVRRAENRERPRLKH